jgi:hypothetical protein
MAGVTGREMKGYAFGFTGVNSWGVATSVTLGTRFATDGGLKYSPQFVEDRSFGEEFLGPAEYGDLNPTDLTLTGQARYEDNNYRLRAAVMGSPAAVTISTSASGQTTSWLHITDLAPSTDGRALTFAFDRKLFVEEVATAKVYGFSERPGDGGVIEESFRVLGVAPTHTSTINTRSILYDASYPALNGKVFRKQGVFRINAQSGGSLGGSDTISVLGSIEFSFERPQDRSYSYGSADIIEPADNEFPLPSIRLMFDRANTLTVNSFRAALSAGTAYKADCTYSGAFINSTDRYTRTWQFPYVEIQDQATPTQGAQQVKPNTMFMLKKPSAAPTGMSGVTQPFRLREIRTNSIIAF